MTVKRVEQLGTLIKDERHRLGMNQSECAALCGVGNRFFSELENGKPTLEIDKVMKVANLMGFDIKVEHK
jgi:HTH-type transcriptional regulator / antitoxin HipB